MKISVKLFATFGGLIFSLLFVTVLSLLAVTELKRSGDSFIHEHYPKMNKAWAIQDGADTVSKSILNLALADNDEANQLELTRLNNALESASTDLLELETMTSDAQGTLIINELKRAGSDYLQFQQRVLFGWIPNHDRTNLG